MQLDIDAVYTDKPIKKRRIRVVMSQACRKTAAMSGERFNSLPPLLPDTKRAENPTQQII